MEDVIDDDKTLTRIVSSRHSGSLRQLAIQLLSCIQEASNCNYEKVSRGSMRCRCRVTLQLKVDQQPRTHLEQCRVRS